MASNIDIDQELLLEAMKLGDFKTKKEAINFLLSDFIRRKKQMGILDFRGKVDYWPDYDYKELRKR